MAKRTKRKRAATSRSRSKSTAARGKATGRKQPARRAKATRTSASKSRTRGRGASSAAPRRRRADIAGTLARSNEPIEILTDPARFESDAPPDAAARARQAADSMAGDQEPGGSVMTPDHNSVDEWAAALGVERSPDSPVRSSEEILHERDERRLPGGPDPQQQRRTI
jgi:hypothetical protein